MERHQHAMVKKLSQLGQVWVQASHNKRDGVRRERATFGDETIYVASYCFQNISSVNIEQQECCVKFWNFSGFLWTFLYINWVSRNFMGIIQI